MDWGLTRNDGTFVADARYILTTVDGANISALVSGPRQSSGYTYSHVTFETGSSNYYWLNDLVAVGISITNGDSVLLKTWRIRAIH